jgi:uncharacterized RDD family membrane protein YckC
MSNIQEQPDWWQASDGRWYPPQGDPPMAPPASAGFQPPPVGMYYDPMSGLVLPDGVELASVERRIAAFFLGLLLIIVTLGIGYLIWGLIVWGGGRTPALQVLRMRCWRPQTGRVAGWWWMALREIIGRILLDVTALIALVSLILMLATRRRQALHDLIAGTVVLYDLHGVLRRG